MSDTLERLKHDRDVRCGWLSPPEVGWLISEIERLEDESRFLAKVVKRLETETPAHA